MGNNAAKLLKKNAKAEIKRQKKASEPADAPSDAPIARQLPDGVSVSVQKRGDGTDLVVTGLSEQQLKRLLPDVTREIMITVTEEQSHLRAGMMRFVREGIFQTIVKVIAGLIVGILLIFFGTK